MKREVTVQLHKNFESLIRRTSDDNVEYWCARELRELLGYGSWDSFEKVIDRAITSCETFGCDPKDHFRHMTKMVPLGSGASRKIDDIALSRYACYLIAQNGDSSKEPIAYAQAYFAIQTRKQELVERRLDELERLDARKKLSISEKELSGLIFERLGEGKSFGFIRSKGDKALFGGQSTQDMKDRLNVPKSRPLADFLPTITIKAKDFANEITNHNVKHNQNLSNEPSISNEHVKNNEAVRKLLGDRGIIPESLPPAEDIRKLERRVESETKKLPDQI